MLLWPGPQPSLLLYCEHYPWRGFDWRHPGFSQMPPKPSWKAMSDDSNQALWLWTCCTGDWESLKGWIKAVLCQLASMSGSNSVKFCSPIQTQPLSVTSQQTTTINLHGKELGFGAEKQDVTSLSCETLLQWHRVDIYLSSQEETSMKDLSQIIFYPLNRYHRIITDS